MKSEEQKQLIRIKRTLNKCVKKSAVLDSYSITEVAVEEGKNLLLWMWNDKKEILEARLATTINMETVAKRIYTKTEIQLKQCESIAELVARKLDVQCDIRICNYRNDVLEVTLNADKVEVFKGDYDYLRNFFEYTYKKEIVNNRKTK